MLFSLCLFTFPWGHCPPQAWAAEQEAEERARLFIALLKRRAQRILQAHRAPPPPLWSVSAGLSQGYESNVNLDGFRRGDYFTEESASLVFRPQFTQWLKGEAGWQGLGSHFMEFTNSNLYSHTFTGFLQFQPHRILRLDLGGEYGILNFPKDTGSSFLTTGSRRISW